MSFSDTSENIWLVGGRYLRASCQRESGGSVDSEIDLNSYIGNANGRAKSQTHRVKSTEGIPRAICLG